MRSTNTNTASPKPLIAFYGATGGSTLACMVECLKAGFDCTACMYTHCFQEQPPFDSLPVARTPSKLTTLLFARGVHQFAVETHLTIFQGDVLKVDDVRRPLSLNGRPADIIVSGIGIVSLAETMSEITLCENAVNNIISVLKQTEPIRKTILVVLSSTGITKTGPRDVPILFMPMYHWILKNPHEDKRRMEAAILKEAQSAESAFGNFVIVRPSLLTSGKALSGSKIRVGTDAKPAVGFSISRDDVGLWMFENLIQGDNSRSLGEAPSITY